MIRRRRLLVLAVAVVVLAFKLWVAATTFGTDDVGYWQSFARGVSKVGPINIYELHNLAAPYNHPPLIGWLLVVINFLVKHGFTLPFLIRVPASVADVVTTLLVFEMLRARRSLLEATAAALLVACSPVLFIISGFHGNTDPVFVMFTLLSAYLLIHRPWPTLSWLAPALAGVSWAVAVSVKIVPFVVLPTLLLIAARLGRRQLAAFIVGCGVVMLPLWGPVVLRQWQPFRTDVLGYAGISLRQWGPVEFATALRFPASAINLMDGSGRFVFVLFAALLPALLLYWRRDAALPAVGLSLVLFLLLSPAFGTQYLAWALAAAYLIEFRTATAYNLLAGGLLFEVYNRWNGGLPWYRAYSTPLHPAEVAVLGIVWVLLLAVAVAGVYRIVKSPAGGTPKLATEAIAPAESTASAADTSPSSFTRLVRHRGLRQSAGSTGP